jgi:Cell division protein 48 (CDC48), N-terminal domain
VFQGKKRKDTICIVLAEENCEEHKIRMNKVVRSNLRVRLSDVVSIHQVRDLFQRCVAHYACCHSRAASGLHGLTSAACAICLCDG